MSLTIALPPELEQQLAETAQAIGTDIASLVSAAVIEKLSHLRMAKTPLSALERAALWRDWVASHPIRPDIILDDSREGMYGDRDR
jgi:hypothetical protein